MNNTYSNNKPHDNNAVKRDTFIVIDIANKEMIANISTLHLCLMLLNKDLTKTNTQLIKTHAYNPPAAIPSISQNIPFAFDPPCVTALPKAKFPYGYLFVKKLTIPI